MAHLVESAPAGSGAPPAARHSGSAGRAAEWSARARPSTARATPRRRATRRRASCARRAARRGRQRSRRDGRLDHATIATLSTASRAAARAAPTALAAQRRAAAALPAARYCPAGGRQHNGTALDGDEIGRTLILDIAFGLEPQRTSRMSSVASTGTLVVPVAKTSSWPSVRDSVPPAVTSPLAASASAPSVAAAVPRTTTLPAGCDSQHAKRQRRRALARDIDR